MKNNRVFAPILKTIKIIIVTLLIVTEFSIVFPTAALADKAPTINDSHSCSVFGIICIDRAMAKTTPASEDEFEGYTETNKPELVDNEIPWEEIGKKVEKQSKILYLFDLDGSQSGT